VTGDNVTKFTLEPIFGSLPLAICLAVITIAVMLWITPPTENPARRRALVALRAIAALILLVTIFRPTLVRSDNRPAEAALIVAVDTSQSMTLPDGAGQDRWSTQQTAWRALADGVIGTDPTLEVRLTAYDRVSRRIPAEANALDELRPDGDLTDLAAAGLAAIESADGKPIAGIVMLGDGSQTAPQSGAGIGPVIETLHSLGVPFWTVPIGPAGGQTAARDVSIDALSESFQLFAGNEFDLSFQVLTRGLVGVDVPITVTWIASDGTETEAAVRRVAATDANQTIPLSISLIAPEPGTFRLRVEAAPQDGELITTNNLQIAFVDVRAGGGRILYLEGSLRYEQTLLRRSLRRFADLDLTFRPLLADTAARWPIDLDDAFEPGKFDIYILGDLDADALGQDQLRQLAAAVSAGAGLITLGGFQTYGAGGYANSALADVLPIKMDAARRQSINAAKQDRGDQIRGPVSPRMARQHPITDLGGAEPAKTWLQLPELVGANRLLGPKVAPGVEVLLETAEGQPLLVIGQFGQGRTAALAFDSTWRWWRGGQSELHRRFWRQLMLWLLSREESGQPITIELDSRRFAINNSPQFRARVESLGQSRDDVQLTAELIDEQGVVSPLDSSRDDADRAIRGQLPKLAAGFYRLRVRAESPAAKLEPAEIAFQAVNESRELANPMADPVLLTQLAGMTAEHGGAAFRPDDIDDLVDTIKQRRRAAETPTIETVTLGDGPLSGWLMFTLFAGTLSTEWLLRRRWGLA
jgi:hypothetical protein